MDWFEALLRGILLGAVQGLTEWLPVSSSGHLAVMQHYLGQVPVLIDILLHVGTMAVVIAFFRKEVWATIVAGGGIMRDLFKGKGWKKAIGKSGERRLTWFLFLGSIPTSILGYLMNKLFGEGIFGNLIVVFTGFGLSGIVLLAAGLTTRRRERRLRLLERERDAEWRRGHREKRGRGRSGLRDRDSEGTDSSDSHSEEGVRDGKRGWAHGFRKMRAGDALFIGTAQGFAVLPGLSRSGTTISTGIMAGVDSETAGRFSFLLSIPAVIGALLFKLKSATGISSDFLAMGVAGMAVAMVVGYLTLGLLMRILKKRAFHWFAPYCFFMAAIVWLMAKGII